MSTNGTARASAVEILTPFADTPAKQRALDRLATSSVRADDVHALDALEDTEALTRAQRRIVQQVRRATWIRPVREERVEDPEMLQRIAEQAAVLEARRLAADAALDTVVLAQLALRTAKDEAQVGRRRSELRAAEDARRVVHEAHERAQALLTDLYVERDERRRAVLLAEQGL